MALSRIIHVEAFIKIPIQYKNQEVEIRTCGEHKNYKGDKFCPICGKKIKKSLVMERIEMDCEDLIGNENLHAYFERDSMYLFSNLYDCGVDTSENVFATITPDLIREKISYFELCHLDDIRILRDSINSDIKVEFGVLNELR